MTVDLAAFAKANGVKYFMISFTDLFGGQRAKLVPAEVIGEMQEEGAGFAGFAGLFGAHRLVLPHQGGVHRVPGQDGALDVLSDSPLPGPTVGPEL